MSAARRSVICSGSFVGCGRIQDDTTEIVNKMAKHTTGTSKATLSHSKQSHTGKAGYPTDPYSIGRLPRKARKGIKQPPSNLSLNHLTPPQVDKQASL